MKKALVSRFAIGPLLSILLYSCYPGSSIPDPYYVSETRQRENLYYVTPAANAPLLTEQGDMSFTVMAAAGSKTNGAEIQGACMPWKHAGFLASYSTGTNKSSITDYTRHYQYEFGAGYVTKFSKGYSFETYGGWGKGRINNHHYTGTSTINASHFFLQPSFAVENKTETLQFAIVSRFAGVNFNVRDTFFSTDREQFSAQQIRGLYEKPFHVMWEPALVFRAGWRNIMFNAQYTYSSDLTSGALHRERNNFSVGVILKYNVITD